MTVSSHCGSESVLAGAALLAMSAFLLSAGCGGRGDGASADWINQTTAQRGDRLLSRLDERGRMVHLSHALVKFIDLQPAGGGAQTGESDAVVFVHGFSGSMGDFAPVVLAMEGEYRMVAFDLPGFGGSLRDDDKYDIEGYVDCLEDLLERLAVRRAHLVCHSLGGQICIGAALSRTPSIATLTLIDSAGVYDPAGFVQGISKRMGHVNVGEVSTARGRALFDVATSDGEIAKRLISREPATLAALASFDERYRERVGEIGVPTAVIWGANDPIFGIEDAFLLKENIRDSRLYVVEGAGHSPQLTHPDLVVGWVRSHIENNRSAEEGAR